MKKVISSFLILLFILPIFMCQEIQCSPANFSIEEPTHAYIVDEMGNLNLKFNCILKNLSSKEFKGYLSIIAYNYAVTPKFIRCYPLFVTCHNVLLGPNNPKNADQLILPPNTSKRMEGWIPVFPVRVTKYGNRIRFNKVKIWITNQQGEKVFTELYNLN